MIVQSIIKMALRVVLGIFALTGVVSIAWVALWLTTKALSFVGPPPYWVVVPALLYLLCFLPSVRKMTRRIVRALS